MIIGRGCDDIQSMTQSDDPARREVISFLLGGANEVGDRDGEWGEYGNLKVEHMQAHTWCSRWALTSALVFLSCTSHARYPASNKVE